MGESLWEQLGEELRRCDQWGDFETAKSHPQAKKWPQVRDHPVNLMVNGCVSSEHYETYVPVLLNSLNELNKSADLEMVVRALTRSGLFAATEQLLKLYADRGRAEDDRHLWAVGNAIYTIAPRDHLAEILCICKDTKLGKARHMLIVHLCRFKKSEDVFETLIDLLSDETSRGPALEALKRLGDVRAIPAIERTPVRDGDEGVYETHQRMMALKKLKEKQAKN